MEEVSSQPFANIPRCIALGVMEGLFILAKKMEGALEEIEGIRLYIVMLYAALLYIHQGHIILIVPVISLLFEVHHNF